MALSPFSALLIHLTGRALGATVNAALLGHAISFATRGKYNVRGVFGGASFEFGNSAVTIFVFGGYRSLYDESSVVSSKAGIRVAF